MEPATSTAYPTRLGGIRESRLKARKSTPSTCLRSSLRRRASHEAGTAVHPRWKPKISSTSIVIPRDCIPAGVSALLGHVAKGNSSEHRSTTVASFARCARQHSATSRWSSSVGTGSLPPANRYDHRSIPFRRAPDPTRLTRPSCIEKFRSLRKKSAARSVLSVSSWRAHQISNPGAPDISLCRR